MGDKVTRQGLREVEFKQRVFGYYRATLLEDDIIAIHSDEGGELSKGQSIRVFADEFNIAFGFVDGDLGIITGFSMPHTDGESDHIVHVYIRANGNTVKVKPYQVGRLRS